MAKYQTYQLVLQYLHRGTEALLEESKYYQRLQERKDKLNKAIKQKRYYVKIKAKQENN